MHIARLLLFNLASIAIAQNTTDAIDVRISDANGKSIHWVTINIGGPGENEMQTDASGNFQFTNLAPGKYVFHARKPVYVSFSRPVTVEASSTARINAQLQILDEVYKAGDAFYRAGSFEKAFGQLRVRIARAPGKEAGVAN